MATLDLLPPNATQFERDLAASSDFLETVEPRVPRIRTAKRIDIPDDVVPWLIYEYGLGELLPYLPDPRVAIAEGVLWQRYRGTPAAIKTALGWINFNATLEESEAGTIRWAQWQLGLDQAPESLQFIENVIGISRLSSPARSDLFRIYGGWYDYRRFWLDDHQLSSGSWLSDHTGVYLQPDWPQLSFGREFKRDPIVQSTEIERTKEHIEGEVYVYEDRFILSQSEVDEFWHLLQETTFTVSRLHFGLFTAVSWQIGRDSWATLEATWQTQTTWGGFSTIPELQYAKAGVYLSDYSVLGETNTCLPCRETFEFGDGPFLLSEGNGATGESVLSQHIQRFEYEEINERFDRQTASVVAPYDGFIGVAAYAVDRVTKRLLRYEDHFWLDYGRLDEDKPFLLESAITIHVTTLSHFYNLPLTDWTTGIWLDGGQWDGTFGSMEPARTFAVAGVYLSENYILGDTDTTFSAREWVESGQEAFELSEPEQATGQSIVDEHVVSAEWLEITDRHERQTASVVAPYTGPLGQLDRAIRREHGTYAIVEDAFVLSGSLLDEEWHLFLFSTYEIIQTSTFAHTAETVYRSGAREVGSAHTYSGETILERQHGRLHQTTVTATAIKWTAWEPNAYGTSSYGEVYQWNVDSDPDSWTTQTDWQTEERHLPTQDWQTRAWIDAVNVWNETSLTVSSQHSSHT